MVCWIFLTEIISLIRVAPHLPHSPWVVASVGKYLSWGSSGGLGGRWQLCTPAWPVPKCLCSHTVQYEDRLIHISYIYLQLSCIEGNININLRTTESYMTMSCLSNIKDMMGFTSVTILNSSSRSNICDGGTLFLTNVPLAEPAAAIHR